MSDHPWLRPLPAMLVMIVVGFWLSFFVRDSESDQLVIAAVALIVVAPVYCLAYAILLSRRLRLGSPAPNATPWLRRVLHQVSIVAVLAVAAALAGLLLAGLAVALGASASQWGAAIAGAGLFVVLVVGLGLLVVAPIEAVYSVMGRRTR